MGLHRDSLAAWQTFAAFDATGCRTPQSRGLPVRSEMSERTACTPEAVAVLPSRHMSGHRRWIVQFLFPCHQCNVTFSCIVCDVVVQSCKAGAPALFQHYCAGNLAVAPSCTSLVLSHRSVAYQAGNGQCAFGSLPMPSHMSHMFEQVDLHRVFPFLSFDIWRIKVVGWLW